MPIGVIAFVVYILAILVWMLVIKRNIAEAMLVGLIVIALFNGPANILTTLWDATFAASKESSFLATMLFLLMAVVMTKTGIIAKLVELLNSMIGRVRGGAAYVSVCASFLFGLVSGNAIANCSTVGAITVPWMKDSGWPKIEVVRKEISDTPVSFQPLAVVGDIPGADFGLEDAQALADWLVAQMPSL